jgi:hypothetical protein
VGKLTILEEIVIFIFACGMILFVPFLTANDIRKNIIKNKDKRHRHIG